ncbi:hypothetical protein NHP194004_16670 [Helicobacter suis]|nr:hypothetical protein NHP194004_16670 [Helicobacter suis]
MLHPGAGKSAAIAIPNLLNLPTSCIVTDIKGELCSVSAGYRQQALHNKIFIFNPFGKDNTCFFNPFDKHLIEPMNFDSKLRLVQEVANNIFIQEDKQEDHWVAKARNCSLFMPSMMFALRTNQTSMTLWVLIKILWL